MSGKFFVFEGGEGSGKSTQVELLAKRLRTCGFTVRETREPGGSNFAEQARELLLTHQGLELSPLSQLLLFYAARNDHLEKVIHPALARDEIVICDRFIDSSYVYQGVCGSIDKAIFKWLNSIVVDQTCADITFVLDVPVSIGLARAAKRRGCGVVDVFEGREVAFHEAVRIAYLELIQTRHKMQIVNAEGGVDYVAEDIWSRVLATIRAGGGYDSELMWALNTKLK